MIAKLTLTKRCLVPTFVFLIDNFSLRSREGGAPTALISVHRNGGHVALAESFSTEGFCLRKLLLIYIFKSSLRSPDRAISPTFTKTLDFDTSLSCNGLPLAHIALQFLHWLFVN